MEFNYDETHQLLTEDWGSNVTIGSGIKNSAQLDEQVIKPGGSPNNTDGKNLYIEGVFLQANILNGNKRIYPKEVLKKAVDNYIKRFIPNKQSLGELNHPNYPYPDPERAAIMIESLWWDGDNVMGRAKVLSGTMGKKVRDLIEDGWIPCVSSRGLGYTKPDAKGRNIVQPGYVLTVAVDVVWGPSAPDAYLKPVYESTEHVDSNKPDPIIEKVDNSNKINLLINGFEKLINK